MATARLRTVLLIGFALAVWLGSARPASAGFVVNGDFSSGLTGWSSSDPSLVSADGGQARLQEPFFDLSVTLWQDIALTAGDQTLAFQLLAFTTEAETFGFLPDAFNVGLLDTVTGESLVSTVLLADGSSSRNYYSRDLVDGVTTGQWAATGVTVTGLAGGGEEISIDVSGLQGRNVRLMFTLLGGGGSYDASVTLDGVAITGTGGGDDGGDPGGIPAVPEPATIVMLLTGCPGLFGLWILRRRGGRSPRVVASPA